MPLQFNSAMYSFLWFPFLSSSFYQVASEYAVNVTWKESVFVCRAHNLQTYKTVGRVEKWFCFVCFVFLSSRAKSLGTNDLSNKGWKMEDANSDLLTCWQGKRTRRHHSLQPSSKLQLHAPSVNFSLFIYYFEVKKNIYICVLVSFRLST